MQWFFLGIIFLCIVVLVSGPLLNANPRNLARSLKIAAGIAALGSATVMFFIGKSGLALPLGAFGLMLLGRGMGSTFGFGTPGGNAKKTAGQASTVRTQWVEMKLDHDTGDMKGRFLKGPYADRCFGDFSETDLIAAYDELLAADGQSAQLLEAYLDRNFKGWFGDRNDADRAGATGSATGPMTRAEAFEILGLDRTAGESDIRAAHRSLMKKIHPDQGGSTILAAKVNQAKDVALGQRR